MALAALLLVAVFVRIGTYTFFPPFVEEAVARGVQDRLGLEEELGGPAGG